MEEIDILADTAFPKDQDYSNYNTLEYVDITMTYNEFFKKFLVNNVPCIINSEITKTWSCRKQWILDGTPNFDCINDIFGNSLAPVANCNKKYYNSQMKCDMTIKEYLKYWSTYRECDYASDMDLLYLKDWHCVKNFPKIPIYTIPDYFSSDWLNEYYIEHPELDDDYMFVYMGPKGSWTPLHKDVFTSFSWSANIVGRKRWLLFPPKQELQLQDQYGQLIYDATSDELHDSSKFKSYDPEKLKYFYVTQEPGEVIFVPSGWHHQVWNLEDTISINHNWVNACNISEVWKSLKKELVCVMKEVEDCRDMENWTEHCQLMLRVSYGMDYKLFYDFISYIARNRLNAIRSSTPITSFVKFKIGLNHCIYDIKILLTILKDFIKDSKDKCNYEVIFKDDEPHNLLNDINSVLS